MMDGDLWAIDLNLCHYYWLLAQMPRSELVGHSLGRWSHWHRFMTFPKLLVCLAPCPSARNLGSSWHKEFGKTKIELSDLRSKPAVTGSSSFWGEIFFFFISKALEAVKIWRWKWDAWWFKWKTLLPRSLTLSKLLTHSEPQFPCPQNGENETDLIRIGVFCSS